jgi:D-glycero-alpha-D-manno-heptose-7-phosphate kinase
MKVSAQGSVRVDLLGGTLDIVPINLLLRKTVTLNIATSLKAVVEIETIDEECVEIVSKDYNSSAKFFAKDFTAENFDGDQFGPLSFVCQILDHFNVTNRVRVTLQSGSPPGAGLGGSSSMGVITYKALCQFTDKPFDRLEAIVTVQSIEAKILNKGPCGYQDYYPALFGGILALIPQNSKIEVEQLYSEKASKFIQDNFTLIYSGSLRLSAINNWEVYKSFFDHKDGVRAGLAKIADYAQDAYQALKTEDFSTFKELLCEEGKQREQLFSNIVTEEMRNIFNKLQQQNLAQGMKVCGAGGGGCFIVAHNPSDRDKIKKLVALEDDMRVLEFSVDAPLKD